jgi:predicted DNA-binding protein
MLRGYVPRSYPLSRIQYEIDRVGCEAVAVSIPSAAEVELLLNPGSATISLRLPDGSELGLSVDLVVSIPSVLRERLEALSPHIELTSARLLIESVDQILREAVGLRLSVAEPTQHYGDKEDQGKIISLPARADLK